METNYNEKQLLPIGTLLQHGKYRVEKHLASGGFGNTYIIVNTGFDRKFAMKEFFLQGINQRGDNSTTVTISNEVNASSFLSQKNKFIKEAKRIIDLHNPYIVRVHDLFEENDTAYYVMDYVEGASLNHQMKSLQAPLPEGEVRRLLPQMLDALSAAHQKGILHLDIKPNNILMTAEGNIVLIDFGASKQVGIDGTKNYSTSTAMCYTPGFAPSEQMDKRFDHLGAWTDIYALGATLYNLLTNETPPLISEISEEGAASFHFPVTVSTEMQKLVIWMMEVSRKKRPQTIDEILEFINENFKEQPTENYQEVATPIEEDKNVEDKKEDADEEKTAFVGFSDNKDKTKYAGKRYDMYEKVKSYGNDSTVMMKKQKDEHEEEKQSFVQKYWKYGAVIIIVLGIIGGLYVKNYMGVDDTIKYYTDLSSIQIGDYLYADGTYTHRLDSANLVNCSGCVYNLTTTDSEKEEGWTHGHIVALKDVVSRNGETEFSWGKENGMIPNFQNYNEAINAKDGYYYCLMDSMSLSPAICSTDDFDEPLLDKSHWYVPTLSDWKDILVNLGNATITEEHESLMAYNNKTVSRTLHEKIGGFEKSKGQSKGEFDYSYWTCIQQGKDWTPDGILPRAWAIYADGEYGMIGNSPTKNKERVRLVAAF